MSVLRGGNNKLTLPLKTIPPRSCLRCYLLLMYVKCILKPNELNCWRGLSTDTYSHSSFWPVLLQMSILSILTPLVPFQNNVITVSEWPQWDPGARHHEWRWHKGSRGQVEIPAPATWRDTWLSPAVLRDTWRGHVSRGRHVWRGAQPRGARGVERALGGQTQVRLRETRELQVLNFLIL